MQDHRRIARGRGRSREQDSVVLVCGYGVDRLERGAKAAEDIVGARAGDFIDALRAQVADSAALGIDDQQVPGASRQPDPGRAGLGRGGEAAPVAAAAVSSGVRP